MKQRIYRAVFVLSFTHWAAAALAQPAPPPDPAPAPDLAEIERKLEANRKAQDKLDEEARELEKARVAAERAALEQTIKSGEAARLRLAALDGEEAAGSSQQPRGADEVIEETTTTTKKPNGETETKKEVKRYSQEALRDAETDSQKFGGVEFGIGVAFTHDLGSNDRVKEAILVDDGLGGKLVRVTDRENVSARFILESHYLLTPIGGDFNRFMDSAFGIGNSPEIKKWGFGPFVAVQPGDDEVIGAIGGGMMIGVRRPGQQTASFNIGVGVLYDLNVRRLGEGIFANQPLPPGETEIRYLEEEQSGLLIMTSYSF